MAQRGLGTLEQGQQRLLRQPLQHQHVAARDQRRGQREGRVLGGGADQRHRAVLDLVQEPVLLGAVEAVDLVDEQDRPPPARPLLLRLLEALPEVGHARHHRRERHQRLVHLLGQQPRQRRLAAAGRPPQDQGRQPAPLQHPRQRRLRPQELLLADQLRQRVRPQPVGERPVACGARRRGGLGLDGGEQVGHGGTLAAAAAQVCRSLSREI